MKTFMLGPPSWSSLIRGFGLLTTICPQLINNITVNHSMQRNTYPVLSWDNQAQCNLQPRESLATWRSKAWRKERPNAIKQLSLTGDFKVQVGKVTELVPSLCWQSLSVSWRIVSTVGDKNTTKPGLCIKGNVLTWHEQSRIAVDSGMVIFRHSDDISRTLSHFVSLSVSPGLTPVSGRFSTPVTRWQPAIAGLYFIPLSVR